MELVHLRTFLQVVATANASRAAETLAISQPAVTQHIRSLEGELSVRLFDRTGRGLTLTPAGVTFQRYAQNTLALLEESRQVLADEETRGGSLVIGAGVTTSICFLPRKLMAFRHRFPAVDVTVRTGSSREVTTMVLDRLVEIGLVTSPIEHAQLESTELFREAIVLVSRPHDPLANKRIALERLAELPLILFRHPSGFRDYLDQIFSSLSIRLNVKMESDSLEAIKGFVGAGLGLAFLPRAAVRSELAAGMLSKLRWKNGPRLERTTTMIRRRDKYLSKPQRVFTQMLARHVTTI